MSFPVARDQLKSIVDRVERLETEIADLNADKSDIYKEARANGFDVKAIKKVVSKRKLDEHEREEQDLVFDTYWDAVHGTNLVHAHVRENIEKFATDGTKYDAETGVILEDSNVSAKLVATVATGMQTETGRKALIKALDIMIEREEAEETHERSSNNDEASPEAGQQAEASPAGTGSGTLADREGRFEGEADSSDLPTNSPETATTQRVNGHSQHEGANAQATVRNEVVTVVGPESGTVSCEYCDDTGDVHRIDGEWLGFCHCEYGKRLQGASEIEIDPNEDRKEGQSLDVESADANTGGNHEVGDPNIAAQAGVLVQSAPAAKSRLRPLCRNPGETCGGHGSTHCHACLKAAKQTGEAA